MIDKLAGDFAVADTTVGIPHPYPPGASVGWIQALAGSFTSRETLNLGSVRRSGGDLVGVMGFYSISAQHERAELAYWAGKLFWGKGFATEVCALVRDYGFKTLRFNKICALATQGTQLPAGCF